MENKYFKPEVEDIRIGYECEIWWNQNMLPENEWCPVKVLQGDTDDFDLFDFTSRISKKEIRVPFLTKEQIEIEGWIEVEERPILYPQINFASLPLEKKGNWIFLENKGNRIWITRFRGSECIFYGECKDINTFRYITKLLGI